MPTSDPRTSDPRRFSVRLPGPLWIGLAAAVLIAIVVGLQVGLPIFRKQAAIREIERLGGYVELYPLPPQWMPAWMGSRWVLDVSSVDLRESKANDETLVCVESLSSNRFSVLLLNDTLVTDAGMCHLRSLTNLRALSLTNTHVSDAALAHLSGLAHLRDLILDDTRVTDAGLAHLKRLKKLKWLEVINTEVTDGGIAELQGALPRVEIEK